MKTAKKEKVAATEKKVTKKAVAPKRKPELVSYSMKMVIPTGQYANIQPEIVVKAGTVEEAHDYIAPHFNKLWKEYFMCSERRPEPKPVVTSTPTPVAHTNPNCTDPTTCQPHGATGPVTYTTADSPVSSVAFTKASQAITSCLSLDALEIIRKQVGASVKLTDDDKVNLVPLLESKLKELNG